MKNLKLYLIIFAASFIVILIFLTARFLKVVDKKASEITTTPIIFPSPTPSKIEERDDIIIDEYNNAPNKKEQKYTLNSGEEITIILPEDAAPPPQEILEELYKQKK